MPFEPERWWDRKATCCYALWRPVGFDRVFWADRVGRTARAPTVLPTQKSESLRSRADPDWIHLERHCRSSAFCPYQYSYGPIEHYRRYLVWSSFPSDDTILNYFRRFSQAEIQCFWRPLWCWLISRLPKLEKGFSLDLDSTIFLDMVLSNKEPPGATILVDRADSVIIRSWRSWQKSTFSRFWEEKNALGLDHSHFVSLAIAYISIASALTVRHLVLAKEVQ